MKSTGHLSRFLTFYIFTFFTLNANSQSFEIGFHSGSDYSLIKGIGQDFPLVVNLHGGAFINDELSLMVKINTSPAWLTQYSSYIELGAGMGYTVFETETAMIILDGMVYTGLLSQSSYDTPGQSILYFAPGLTPAIKLSEQLLLAFPFHLYFGTGNNRGSKGIRFMLGLRYRLNDF